MADHLFENQTITQEGLNLIAHATAADAIVYTKALSNATVPSDPSIVSSYSGKEGTIDSASSSGSAARITLSFGNSDTMSSQAVKCVALMGRLHSGQGDGVIVAYCSDGESSITLPSSLDAPCVTRFVVNLVMSACSGSTINVVESGVASQSDLSRFVSTHKAGSPEGEDQNISGTKTFLSGVRSTGVSVSDAYEDEGSNQMQGKRKQILLSSPESSDTLTVNVSNYNGTESFEYTNNLDRIDFIEQAESGCPAQRRSIRLDNYSEDQSGRLYHSLGMESSMASSSDDTSFTTYSTVECGTIHSVYSDPCDYSIYHNYHGYFDLYANHSGQSNDDSNAVQIRGEAFAYRSTLTASVTDGNIHIQTSSSSYNQGDITIEAFNADYDAPVTIKSSSNYENSSVEVIPSSITSRTNDVFQVLCNDPSSENRSSRFLLQPGFAQLSFSEGVNGTKKSAWIDVRFQGGETANERVMSVEPYGDEGISWQLGYPGSSRSAGCKFASIACKTMYCDDLQIEQTPLTSKLLQFITGSPTESQVRHDPEVGAICLCRVNNFNDFLHPGEFISGNYLTYVALKDTGNGITNTSVDNTPLEGTWVLLTYSQGSGSLVLVVRVS